jgi:hypothetical protein
MSSNSTDDPEFKSRLRSIFDRLEANRFERDHADEPTELIPNYVLLENVVQGVE